MTPEFQPPKISVVIPVFHAEKTLARALDSVFAQTLSAVECVAVLDGPDAASEAILDRRAEKEPRLKVVKLAVNRGTYSARKRAVEEAAGKYLLFLDPDDALEPSAAEKLYGLAEKYDADMIHFDPKEFETLPDGRVKQVWNWCPCRPGFVTGKNAVLRDLLCRRGHTWNLCLKLIRTEIVRSALAEIPEFYCVMGEDMYACAAAGARARNILKINEKPYDYYIAGSGITTARKRSAAEFGRLASLLRALAETAKLLPDDAEIQTAFHDAAVKQCRILLTRLKKEVAENERADAERQLFECGYASAELTEAARLPDCDANAEDLPSALRPAEKLIALFFPKGTRRRVWLKTRLKRLLGKG